VLPKAGPLGYRTTGALSGKFPAGVAMSVLTPRRAMIVAAITVLPNAVEANTRRRRGQASLRSGPAGTASDDIVGLSRPPRSTVKAARRHNFY
jgi:hypothetical protein